MSDGRSALKKEGLALRYNQDKVRWQNVPLWLLEPVIKVGCYGEKKYDTFNFLKGFPVNELMDSIKRHLKSLESPFESDIDKESGESHAACVAWNAIALAYVLTYKPELDNRWKPELPIDKTEIKIENK